jgi:CheY-like chemotaxis protein
VKILIIDDEEDIRRVARLALSHVGQMEVAEAETGAEGVRLAAAERPDGILLDLTMPGMDGRATLTALRRNAETGAIPVIFLTARTGAADEEELRRLGVVGVLSKPFDPLRLPEQVRLLLGGSGRSAGN